MKISMKKIASLTMTFVMVATMLAAMATVAGATERPTFDTSITTIQNLQSFVTVDNNKDGTITLHMPTLSSTTVNTKSMCSRSTAQDHTIHYGYEKGSGTSLSRIGDTIATNLGWSGHTSFTSSDITVDITSGQPRTAIIVCGHLASCNPCPGDEAFWGLMRYTNPVKVTYDLNGGNIGGSTDNKVEYLHSGDALQTTFDAPVLAGSVFDGWYTQAEGGEKVTVSAAQTGQPTTYYAHFTHVHDYSDSWSKDETGHWHECTSGGTCDTPKADAANHVYNQEVVSEEYLKSAATYTEKAVYYKSCVCGEKGTETFENGDVLPSPQSDEEKGTEPIESGDDVPKSPDTGDRFNTAFYLVLCAVSAVALVYVLRRKTVR